MPYITGMGCTLTAIIASFCAINKNHITACLHAISYFTLCGKLAGKSSKYPSSFHSSFIDELFKANFNQMQKYYD